MNRFEDALLDQDVEKKKSAYTIKNCLASTVKAKSCVDFCSDPRKDDLILFGDRDDDLNEPPRLGRDDMMPSSQITKERSIGSIEVSLTEE